MIPMLPLCNSCPIHPRMMRLPPMMVPMLSIPVAPAPVVCPPSHVNMSLSTTTKLTDEYDSHIYGRFRHVERDYPNYRHIPFDWYRPPKQQYNVIHEDVAIITLDGPISLDQFYRHYIYGDDVEDSDSYDDDDDSTSYLSEESDFDDEEENRQSMNYSKFNSNRPPTVPPRRNIQSSNYSRNQSFSNDDTFNDAASVDNIYAY